MTDQRRRLLLAGAAAIGLLVIFVVGRRSRSSDPLVAEYVPTAPVDAGGGFDDGGFAPVEPAPLPPVLIPTPGGGAIVLPPPEYGEPIVVLPPAPVGAPANPAPPAPAPAPRQETLSWFGRTWRRNEGTRFRGRWREEMQKRNRPDGAAAWATFLANHPGVKAFFGF